MTPCAPNCLVRWDGSSASVPSRSPRTPSPRTWAPSGRGPVPCVAAGTGLIAIGTDLTRWRRADGWGHLLGDCGSGAWIGRAGLEAALRAYDGRPGGSAGAAGPRRGDVRPGAGAAGQALSAPGPACGARLLRAPRGAPAPRAIRSPRASCGRRPGTWPSRRPRSVRPRASPGSALTGGLFRMGDPLLVPLKRGVGAAAAARAAGAGRG